MPSQITLRDPIPARSKGVALALFIALYLVAMLLASNVVKAEADYTYCLLCHGSASAGNQPIGGPNLTMLPGWYIEEQLLAFTLGYRGQKDDDHYGRSMAAAARMLVDDSARRSATEFIGAYPQQYSPSTLTASAETAGDPARGATLFQQCVSCHGDSGVGNEALHAPPLTGQADWYLARQLFAYREGYRGVHPDDIYGQSMRAMALQLNDDQAVYDVVAHVRTLAENETQAGGQATGVFGAAAGAPSTTAEATDTGSLPGPSPTNEINTEENTTMKRKPATSTLKSVVPAMALAAASTQVLAHDVTRYPLPNNSTFPIAQAVSVPAGTELMFHSGLLPSPANPDADPSSREFFGDTYTQTMSVLQKFEASLKEKGMGLGNIIKMNVFLVGDPEMEDKMDFGGFMRAYSQFFGTEAQPHLPARAAVQVAGLARGALIEIEVIAAR